MLAGREVTVRRSYFPLNFTPSHYNVWVVFGQLFSAFGRWKHLPKSLQKHKRDTLSSTLAPMPRTEASFGAKICWFLQNHRLAVVKHWYIWPMNHHFDHKQIALFADDVCPSPRVRVLTTWTYQMQIHEMLVFNVIPLKHFWMLTFHGSNSSSKIFYEIATFNFWCWW